MSEVKGLKGWLEGAEGLQRVAREDVECRGSISARVSSDEGKKKKKEKKEKGRRRERQHVQRKRECELLTISSESTSLRED